VFGTGKTRSAAALLAGLLVFDRSLQLIVLTKKNVVHAVAEHLVSLQLPDHTQKADWSVITSKIARLLHSIGHSSF